MRLTSFIVFTGVANYLAIIHLSHVLNADVFSRIIYITGLSALAAYVSLLGFHSQALESAYTKNQKINVFPLNISMGLFSILTFSVFKINLNWTVADLILFSLIGLSTIISEYACIRLRLTSRYAFYSIISKPLFIFYVLLVLLTLRYDFDENTIIISSVMTLSVICIALCCFIANHNQVSISTAIKNWPRAKGYYFFTFIFCLNLQIGPIILGQIGESNQIAEFSIALIGVNASNLIINAYFGVQRQEAFYKALKESHEVALSVIWDSLRLAAFFAVFLSALMYIIINFFYIYIFDLRKYPDIVILSNIAMASVPIRIIHASLSPLMSSEEYMRIKNYYLGIAHIAGWVTSYLLASKWGAVGIFVGLILTESITAISYLSTAYQGQMRFRGRGW